MTSPAEPDPARNRFIVITMMRFFGVLMVVAAIAVVQGVLPLPQWTAWLLAVLGVIEAFLMPTLLARMWSTNDK